MVVVCWLQAHGTLMCSRTREQDQGAEADGGGTQMCSSSVPSEADRQAESEAVQPPTPAQAACQYGAWHRQFQRHALRSRVIELPHQFVEYLLADGVFVGDGSKALPAAGTRPYDSDEEASSAGDDDEQGDGDEEEEHQDWTELFPELHRVIAEAILDLGGQVVPKLNWSCPTDAVWVNPNGSLACENAEQVVLMLKSSDRVAHDLELLTAWHRQHQQHQQQQQQPAAGAAPEPSGSGEPAPPLPPSTAGARGEVPTLVLRKWHDLRPEREWRCFVRAGQLVAVSQRDPTQHYPQLCGAACSVDEDEEQQQEDEEDGQEEAQEVQPDALQQGPLPLGPLPLGSPARGPGSARRRSRPSLHPAAVGAGPEARQARDLLARFHQQHVAHAFTSLQHYTYDAYVATTGTIKLIDFNPVGDTTSPLLFDWHELGLADVAEGNGSDALPPPTPQQEGSDGAAPSAVQQGSGGAVPEGAARQGGGARRVLLRVVPAASYVQAGHRAACAMPFDMLGLQNSIESMVGRMQQQN